ncbi:MAG: alpha/beta hydrolase [Eubacteriales bacterium]
MCKYGPLWDYVGNCGKEKITLTFEKIAQIAGVPVDHSFLRFKKELTKYGYAVEKISMKEQKIVFERIPDSRPLVLYVHGKGGSAAESEHYRPLFPDCSVVGLDYTAETPWEAKEEFPPAFQKLSSAFSRTVLIANSIGAYFSMQALPQEKIERAYFISPVVDMEKLICGMMHRAKVSEAELREKGRVKTDFGETLSWAYLSFVRAHPVRWNVPTKILYGEWDQLTSQETISLFANAHQAGLMIMEGGEHWFHTPEQMSFLDAWIKNCENEHH